MACVNPQPKATLKPVTIDPKAKPQRYWWVLKKKYKPMVMASKAITMPPSGPKPVMCSKSREGPPSTSHQLAKA